MADPIAEFGVSFTLDGTQPVLLAFGKPYWLFSLSCLACGHYFLETHGTLFYGKQHSATLILYALASLAEGMGLRATARIFNVEPNTVLTWLMEAAEHTTAVSNTLLHDLKVTQVQLDELFALVAE